jgi:hypothetical protein
LGVIRAAIEFVTKPVKLLKTDDILGRDMCGVDFIVNYIGAALIRAN